MLKNLWAGIRRARRQTPTSLSYCRVVITERCCQQIVDGLSESVVRRHEGILYFIGLTTGTVSLAVSGICPEMTSTPGSVDVSALEIGKINRAAMTSGLQVVGQLHTHPGSAYHSEGDLIGMRIRYPGYFSVVAPHYGTHLPSLQGIHALMWTDQGFYEVELPIQVFEG